MVLAKATSTGHAQAGTDWLDAHFQAARAEYEDALCYVGVQPGWRVLDAGCGGGAQLPISIGCSCEESHMVLAKATSAGSYP